MTKEELKNILPHRDNMLLLDEAYIEDDCAHGKVTIRGDEWFLGGHFPNNPVVPGVMLCEMMAQSTCVLLADKLKENELPFFTGLDKVKFRKPVTVGDTIHFICQLGRSKPPFYFAEGKGYVGENLSVEAKFSFALTEV